MATFEVAGPVALNAGVISRARARGRRRRLALLAATAALAGSSIGAGVLAGAGAHVLSSVEPGALLAQAPRIGITCGAPSCDRLGVAVWLRRPARSVSASLAGRHVTLRAALAAAFQPGPAARRTMFVGYLHAPSVFAHLTLGPGQLWAPTSSARWPAPRLRINVALRAGGYETTALPVPLQLGWG
ncbi:MAG TPA: hypothetical protein VHX66_04890 [Solirubrobacteraceae bacterium]|jgi:hypothetical protein|nr:hypothetical protein [Solirubrobacteraceae bacterium]